MPHSALATVTELPLRENVEERLARTAIQLARRNEALEDFAALVAHELKTPLQAALLADDPSSFVEDALFLVDALLDAAQNEADAPTFSSAAEALDQAVEDLRVEVEVEVTADLATTLPLPQEQLRVILRNLLSNAVSAGAHHVHVAATRGPHVWQLLVDDDGGGLTEDDGYASGSGLGLALSRRIAVRFRGELRLAPLRSGGTRATLEFLEVA
jgi:signal transduction histidine kinase